MLRKILGILIIKYIVLIKITFHTAFTKKKTYVCEILIFCKWKFGILQGKLKSPQQGQFNLILQRHHIGGKGVQRINIF